MDHFKDNYLAQTRIDLETCKCALFSLKGQKTDSEFQSFVEKRKLKLSDNNLFKR